jgi:hypothetical protein
MALPLYTPSLVLPLEGNGRKLRIRFRASTSPLRGGACPERSRRAQHERRFSARPERSVAKSKDERNANFAPLPLEGGGEEKPGDTVWWKNPVKV